MAQIIPVIILLVLFYLILILPNQLQSRRVRKMQSSLAIGDHVVTAGGLVGSVAELGQDVITLDVGYGTKVRVTRSSVAQRMGPASPVGS
ncbi:MAG: preprotein translocase subunit YajC [Candidatus Sericytochromatia bacterium]|uniref:Preprotein translocase subunit YajC n=1 Tax=Candidatus Tanganyikabacteria bacterium TaxID=2961651 RepID=A0A938BMG2_9BACT|nr:preprotein translocase subunit YajC [Candidatus Tanganyikabacteria bacterium]